MNPTTTPILTRFRVQTALPLEPLKVWHTISSESGLQCIEDVARDIALTLRVDTEVVLELDGFVLLATSPVGAIRDGDMITVKCKPHVEKRKAVEVASNKSQKRQKTDSPATPPIPIAPSDSIQPRVVIDVASGSKQLHASAKPPAPASSSSSDTTSSDSESDSDSDSSSDISSDDSDSSSESSTDTDSDSDSDSNSDAAPTPQPIVRQALPTPPAGSTKTSAPSITPRPPPTQPPVPPGQGKQSTKSRNARRRIMKKHQAAGTDTTSNSQARNSQRPSSPGSPRTSTPTGTPSAPAPTQDESLLSTTTQTRPPAPIAPAKHANKNKRKGFDKDMADAVATRITFGSLAPLPTPPAKSKSQYTHYHVIPPSQRKDLPSNVVVTSVDVEAMDGMEGVGQWFDGEAREVGQEASDTSQKEQAKDEQLPTAAAPKIDWEVVDTEWENKWDSFKTVGGEGWKTLKVGELLGWKALTIDPATCTPCMKIHLARVNAPIDLSSAKVECFVIDRPGAGGIGFGFGGPYEDEGMNEGGDADSAESGENQSVEVGGMEGWKVIA